jgi:multidrug efflux pump subunit AcrA (membrane-fusion protein)
MLWQWLRPIVLLGVPLLGIVLWGAGVFNHRVPAGVTALADTGDALDVRTTVLAPLDSDAVREFTGNVVAAHSALIASQLMARIESLHAFEGEKVTAGALLAQLDARDLNARVEAASAADQRAQGGVSAAQAGVEAARASLEQARAQAQLAEITLQRVQALHAEGGATDQNLTEAQAAHAQAQAGLKAARQQAEASRGQQKAAQAGRQEAVAAASLAATTRRWARIEAPFTGFVVARMAEQGAMAAPGQPLFRLERGPFRLDVPVDERLLPRLRGGQKVPVALEALGTTLEGTIQRVIPAVDPATRSGLVQVALPDHPAVRSGMHGRARVATGRSQRLQLPEEALVRWYQLTSVYVVGDDARANLRLVRLGESQGAQVEVLAGLSAGERVVLAPPTLLRDGAKVRF